MPSNPNHPSIHPLGGKNVLNMCDLFEDDYKEFVLGELTELWDTYRESRIDVMELITS